MAIRDRVLSAQMMPTLISKAPTLYQQLSSGIHTNLDLDQIIKLAWLASQIPEENIKQGVIGPPDQVNFAQSPDGSQQVLKPITEKIRQLRDEVFLNTGALSPVASNTDLIQLMKLEGAKVSILNGSVTNGIASRTSDYLKSQGVNVAETGNAEAASTNTKITFYTGKPYTVRWLTELMKIRRTRSIS